MLTPLVLTAGTKQSESFKVKRVDNSAESENVSMKSAENVRLTGGKGKKKFPQESRPDSEKVCVWM